MTTEVTLPDLGEDAGEEAEVSFWYVDIGDEVEEGDDLVEMVTEKAAFTVPAPADGVIKEIHVDEGDTVHVGDVLALMEE